MPALIGIIIVGAIVISILKWVFNLFVSILPYIGIGIGIIIILCLVAAIYEKATSKDIDDL